ncbi:hypothetical protein [Caenimonas aquaedulcis]|uniref:hypothetical protein n=1 Tax=Caenimonas aquaedulcis TaxID=2793270 RepID=UPI001E2F6250|nr:hypothetical protein [Caenimonas aquaedulcis]
MGRFVAISSAIPQGSHFRSLLPDQRFLNSCGLATFCCVLAAYSVAGILYGQLPFFVLSGFIDLDGIAALLASLGSGAWAAGAASHLWQRHWSGAQTDNCVAFRRACYRVCWITWALAVVVIVLGFWEVFHLRRPWGVSPSSEWPLAPLPWVWHYGLRFASNGYVVRLLVLGAGAITLFLLLARLRVLPRVIFALMAAVLALAGSYFIGDASYWYAAARDMGPVSDPDLRAALAANPGLYNAHTFVRLWSGLLALSVSALLLAGAIFLPAQVVANIDWGR